MKVIEVENKKYEIIKDYKDAFELDVFINSYTDFFVQARYDHYTLLRCVLKTGRTHQIRVHLKSKNKAIVGDLLYGGVDKDIKTNGQLLFAYKIKFVHPTTQKEMQFEAELPDYFQKIVSKLAK